jgi:phage shock protein C
VAERLYRSRDGRMLAGVAAGVAETLDADPSLVRIVWAVLVIFTGGLALLVYIVMAIVVPEAPAGWSAQSAAGFGAVAPDARDAAGTSGGAGTPAQAAAGDTTSGGTPAARSVPGSYWATDREARRAARRAHRDSRGDSTRAGLVGGLVLIVIGGIFLIREVVPWFDWNLWWPIGLILLGGLLLVFALLPNRRAK